MEKKLTVETVLPWSWVGHRLEMQYLLISC